MRKTMARKDVSLEATVSDVVGKGSSRYAVVFPKTDDPRVPQGASITFSLQAWTGDQAPKKGQVVRLFNIEKFARGWRARRAQAVRL